MTIQSIKDVIKLNKLYVFGSEWFGIAISTLALAQVLFLMSREVKNSSYATAGDILVILGILIFLVVMVLWIARGLTIHDKKCTHWNNLTRLSFTALIPIIMFVLSHLLISIEGFSVKYAYIYLYDYFINYFLALALGVILGYRLYTKEIGEGEINYAIIIPPLSIGTSIFLATPLLSYYTGNVAQLIYFMVIMGLGIFFFLYIFIGSIALSGHITHKSEQVLPTAMLPVGVSSLILINLLSISSFGTVISHIGISIYTVGFISILLWGFEVWNFLVVFIIIIRKSRIGYMSAWAYGFPLGLFATSTFKLQVFTHFTDF
ncbi:MAG: C4-dicarboxylate ABC transporter, partial [Ferroplasma sp.]